MKHLNKIMALLLLSTAALARTSNQVYIMPSTGNVPGWAIAGPLNGGNGQQAGNTNIAGLHNLGFAATIPSATPSVLVLSLTQADGVSNPAPGPTGTPVVVDFRNASLTNGGVVPVTFSSPLSLTVPATCGAAAAAGATTLSVYLVKDTVNDLCIDGSIVSENGTYSPAAISGCTTSTNVQYCNSSHTNVAVKYLGTVSATWSNPNWSAISSVTQYRSGAVNSNQIVAGAVTTGKIASTAIPGQTSILGTPGTYSVYGSGSGTYTVPTNPSPLYIDVLIIGAGGGGGGGGNQVHTGSDGTAGGSTTFGSATCNGGGQGYSTGSGGVGGLGGSPGGGSLSNVMPSYGQSGTSGGASFVNGSIAGALAAGGTGGSSVLGGGGYGGSFFSANGQSSPSSNNYGGGGGGGTGGAIGTTSGDFIISGGGGGGGGSVRAKIFPPFSATYSYSIGSGGSGGAAGTGSGGGGGGNGSNGIVIVMPYYQ